MPHAASRCPPPRPPARQHCQPRRGSQLIRCSIGFDLPGAPETSKSIEKTAEELTRRACSLLIYQAALAPKPAQALLKVLMLLQKGAPTSLLESYGQFFSALAAEDTASWADYLLEQVIKGSENALAKAAARGENTARFRAAAAADLDTLQSLALTESTVAGWVHATAYGLPDGWLAAASSLGGPGGASAAAESLALPSEPPAALLGPPTEAQRAGLRAEIAGHWRWSEAVPALTRHYAAHGYGLVAAHRVLTWNGSRLQAQDVLKGVDDCRPDLYGDAGYDATPSEALKGSLAVFLSADLAEKRRPPHLALSGAARWAEVMGALAALQSSPPAGLEAAAGGLRVVTLPPAHVGSLPELAWALSQHPRARFAVVAASLEGLSAAQCGEYAAMLSGAGGFSWPANMMLVGGFDSKVPPDLAPLLRGVPARGA